MAEGKKTFILYKNWKSEIESLKDSDAGILFLNILEFVNNTPMSGGMSDQTKLLFIKIKNQIEHEWEKYNPLTKKYHWNYQGGITSENKKIRNSSKYQYWRGSVFSRDNYTCQKCFSFGGVLNAHHIKPFSSHPELRTELSNGITLCVECHKEEHK